MKKLSLILAVILILGVFTTTAMADGLGYDFVYDGFIYGFRYDWFMPGEVYDPSALYAGAFELSVYEYQGENIVDVNSLPNGIPSGLYLWQIMEAVGDEFGSDYDYDWNAHRNEFVPVLWQSISYYDSNETVRVMASKDGVQQELLFSDQKPVIIDDRTLLPIRAVAEFFGWNVGWDEATEEVTIDSGDVKYVFPVGTYSMYELDASGSRKSTNDLDVASCVINGRTMLPVRAVAEALGVTVDWNEAESCVVLTK